ncbi:MAG TPA: type II secretion system protein GspJ [candidate division Zixibacteria bacterium]|nr:type II secretion system protein GspJ [candidate division Zixibacteria bacterium]
MKPQEKPPVPPAGFTLIEVVLAMTIFALMATILYGAFALGHSAIERTRGRFDENQKLRSFSDLLAGYIRSSYPYRPSPQDPAVYYEGQERRLAFVSSISVAMGGRGMARVELSWSGSEDGEGALLLEEQVPVRLDGESEESGQRSRVVLDERVRDVRLAYLDPQGDGESWESEWSGGRNQALPRAVRLAYRTAAGREVQWTFPIMMTVLQP